MEAKSESWLQLVIVLAWTEKDMDLAWYTWTPPAAAVGQQRLSKSVKEKNRNRGHIKVLSKWW